MNAEQTHEQAMERWARHVRMGYQVTPCTLECIDEMGITDAHERRVYIAEAGHAYEVGEVRRDMERRGPLWEVRMVRQQRIGQRKAWLKTLEYAIAQAVR